MKNSSLNKFFTILLFVLSIPFTLLTVFLYASLLPIPVVHSLYGILDEKFALGLGNFYLELVGTTAGVCSSLLIVFVFFLQQKQTKITQTESNFYKMLDFHRDNVNRIVSQDHQLLAKENYHAFVSFTWQLFECLKMAEFINGFLQNPLSREEKIDVAYMDFYFDIGKSWNKFSKDLLARYGKELSREIFDQIGSYKNTVNRSVSSGKTNQTVLSSYFRNMYNAIMLIHENNDLNRKQKKQYIKILRAQLSNPELVILYFNIMSRFGKKWRANNLIMEYELLKNLPLNSCNGYNPKEDFPLEYEEEELME